MATEASRATSARCGAAPAATALPACTLPPLLGSALLAPEEAPGSCLPILGGSYPRPRLRCPSQPGGVQTQGVARQRGSLRRRVPPPPTPPRSWWRRASWRRRAPPAPSRWRRRTGSSRPTTHSAPSTLRCGRHSASSPCTPVRRARGGVGAAVPRPRLPLLCFPLLSICSHALLLACRRRALSCKHRGGNWELRRQANHLVQSKCLTCVPAPLR